MSGLTPAQLLKREQDRAKREALELALLQQLKALGLASGLEREHRFHEQRQFRFDFAFPHLRLAIEVDGGIWSRGRHTDPRGYAKDCQKFAEAAILGWRVIRATGDQVTSGIAVQWVQRALEASA
jgi:very-short-patch-repair endonuclease